MAKYNNSNFKKTKNKTKNKFIDFNNFKMITNIKEHKKYNNTYIVEINKIYETTINLDYNTYLENNCLFLNDDLLNNLPENRIESLKVGVLNLLSYNISNNLINKNTNRKTIYISENSNIPLIGHTAFGLIDRGTNIIQVRGLSGCNISCPFCSVDEGKVSKTRKNDFYVDYEYLVNEYRKIVEFKGNKHIEAHLDGQGEPSLYYPLPDLINNLNEINEIGNGLISIQTNGVNLSYKLIDELEECKLHRINLSINAIDSLKSKILAGSKDYNINKIIEMAEYIKNSKIHLLITSLLLPNYNNEDFKEVIDFGVNLQQKNPQNIINPITKRQNPILGVQLCLSYKFGRKFKKMKLMKFNEFYKLLRSYEEHYKKEKNINVQLDLSKFELFGTHKRKKLPYPFKLNEVVKTKIILDGRVNGELIGVAKNRVVQIIDFNKDINKLIGKTVNVKINRVNDNIIVGYKV